MDFYSRFLRPIFFSLDAEEAHDAVVVGGVAPARGVAREQQQGAGFPAAERRGELGVGREGDDWRRSVDRRNLFPSCSSLPGLGEAALHLLDGDLVERKGGGLVLFCGGKKVEKKKRS